MYAVMRGSLSVPDTQIPARFQTGPLSLRERVRVREFVTAQSVGAATATLALIACPSPSGSGEAS
jgi:hypothetical protein